MASNVALRSSSTRADIKPASVEHTMSLWTIVTTISVEWCCRYADWRAGNRPYWFAWTFIQFTAKRSTVLETQLRLEIGLYDLISSWSKERFLSLERILRACASLEANPVWKTRLPYCHRCDYRCKHITDPWQATSVLDQVALLVRRFPQDLRYLFDSHVVEASEWRNLSVLGRWSWSSCYHKIVPDTDIKTLHCEKLEISGQCRHTVRISKNDWWLLWLEYSNFSLHEKWNNYPYIYVTVIVERTFMSDH